MLMKGWPVKGEAHGRSHDQHSDKQRHAHTNLHPRIGKAVFLLHYAAGLISRCVFAADCIEE